MRKIVDNYRQEEKWFLVVMTILSLLALTAVLTACEGRRGDSGFKGDSGISGAEGPQGSAGSNGNNGSQGIQGPAGMDGHIATVVPVCPGTPVYGSVYVEIALCINNELYAVYSANGGFMTKLTPGNYSSNAIGSACNVTVLEDCEISH